LEKDISCLSLPWFYIPCEQKIVAVGPKGTTQQIEYTTAQGNKVTRTIGKRSRRCTCARPHRACVLFVANKDDFMHHYDVHAGIATPELSLQDPLPFPYAQTQLAFTPPHVPQQPFTAAWAGNRLDVEPAPGTAWPRSGAISPMMDIPPIADYVPPPFSYAAHDMLPFPMGVPGLEPAPVPLFHSPSEASPPMSVSVPTVCDADAGATSVSPSPSRKRSFSEHSSTDCDDAPSGSAENSTADFHERLQSLQLEKTSAGMDKICAKMNEFLDVLALMPNSACDEQSAMICSMFDSMIRSGLSAAESPETQLASAVEAITFASMTPPGVDVIPGDVRGYSSDAVDDSLALFDMPMSPARDAFGFPM
jgi:hypothetical protein